MALRSAEFCFAVNKVLIKNDSFRSRARFDRDGFQVEIVFSDQDAISYSPIHRDESQSVWVVGKIVQVIEVHVLEESPLKRNLLDDADTEAADGERIDFLKRALPVAEAVSSEFIEWLRLRQPWLGVHGQRPQRIGDPVVNDEFSSSTYYAKLVLPHTSPDEPDYPADVFLDQAGLDSFVPLLNDCRPELPVGESLLADALYFLSSDPPDLQRAVITAAIGCEVKVKRTIRSKAPAASLKLIDLILESPRDWSLAAIALFDKGAEAALGRSLKSDNRELLSEWRYYSNSVTRLPTRAKGLKHLPQRTPSERHRRFSAGSISFRAGSVSSAI